VDIADNGNNMEKPAFFEMIREFPGGLLMQAASLASIAAFTTLLAGSAEAMPTPAPYRADSGIILAEGGAGPLTFGMLTARACRTGGAAVLSWRQDSMAAAGIMAVAGTAEAGTGAITTAVAGTAGVTTVAAGTAAVTMAAARTFMAAAPTSTGAVTAGDRPVSLSA
jgi:hypothetical protein